jgi:glycosyltransferase involved in cell wall biosynthesis
VEQLKTRANELHIASSVLFTGPVTGAAKSWLLHRCGIFVLPSENENFAISVAEAMLAGAVAIVTDQVASAEHVTAARAGLVIPAQDINALSSALGHVLDADDAELLTMGRRGRAYAEQYLSWTAFATRFLSSLEGHVLNLPTSGAVDIHVAHPVDGARRAADDLPTAEPDAGNNQRPR